MGVSKDPMLFMKGMQAQDISVKGDASVLMGLWGGQAHCSAAEEEAT